MRFFHPVLPNCNRELRAGAGLRTCECLIGHSAKRERDSAKPSTMTAPTVRARARSSIYTLRDNSPQHFLLRPRDRNQARY
jgi:hypothetical protein